MPNWLKKKSVIIPVTPPQPPSFNLDSLINKGGLLGALKQAVVALEKDYIFYDWNKPHSCNCGLVIQALTGLTSGNVSSLFSAAKIDAFLKPEDRKSWRDVCQVSCSITGEPIRRVFKKLKDLGMRPEDIVHLEFLSNKAILELSDIDVSTKEYYSNKKNLIKYLQSWVMIIENKYDENRLTQSAVEEAKLLITAAHA